MKKMTTWCVLLALVIIVPWQDVFAQSQAQVNTQNLLTRWYELGERVSYQLTGTTNDRTGTTSYTATVSGVVKQDDMMRFFEELEWSKLVSNGMPIPIPQANQQFRQILSLSPTPPPIKSDVLQAYPRLIGLALDLQSLYADASAAMQQSRLRFAGDRAVVFNRGDTNSWADGARVLLGEDSTDIELMLDELNLAEGTATVTALHVPPGLPKIKIPADWMGMAVGDTRNNWTQVVRAGARQFVASVGQETSEVKLQLSLSNGKIYSARMNHRVEVFERECTDEAVTMCREGIRYQLTRSVTIS